MDNKSTQNGGHNKLTISSSSMLPLPSSISRPPQPPPPLPLPLLAAGYVPPPKSPLCFSSSSPLAGGNISSESSSPSNCPISSSPSPSFGGLMPPIGGGGQTSPNSICARRRVPTPLSFIAIREPSSQFHSPFFGQSSATSSALQSPQLFILNSPRTPASISLSPFLVPRVLEADDAGPLRECSPPPRRCSYASTLSENSSISLNTSYQSLLFSPLICPDQGQCCAAAQRSRSSTYCSEGEADTPPTTNEAEFIYAQQQLRKLGGGGEGDNHGLEEMDLDEEHRSKRSQCFHCIGIGSPQRQRRSHSAISTTCEGVSPSPTVLLSPVLLSRPIRSQSSHSPNLIRSASAAGQQPPSDSESELMTTPALCCSRGTTPLPHSRQSPHSRLSTSRPSNSSSPLATPPPLLCTSPIPLIGQSTSRNVSRSGSFSRHLLQQQHSFCSSSSHYHFSSSSQSQGQSSRPAIGRCHSFSRHQHPSSLVARGVHHPLRRQRTGTFSHHDSFESSTSAGESFPNAQSTVQTAATARRISGISGSPLQHPLLAGRPPSAAAQLQRSHSDALDPSLSRHSSAGSAAGGSRFAGGSPGTPAGERLHYNSAKRSIGMGPIRRPSTSLRDLQQNDLLHSSLDSSGSYREPNSSFHPLANQHQLTSSIGAGQLQFLGAPQRQNINNLMRLRLCPLGHSDPQIYTYTQTPFYVPISNTPTNAICTGRYSVASGGGHRSFLSASPQANKLQKETLLTSPPPFTSTKYLHHHQGGSPHGADHLGGGSRKSPVQMRMHRSSFSSMGSGHHHHPTAAHHGSHHHGHHHGMGSNSSSARPSISGPGIIRQPVALRAIPHGHHLENRRWSLASLPSSSGYGTPGTNSAYSSQYSSQENLAGIFGDLRIRDRFDSNESYACCLGEDFVSMMRPRSRSLTSPGPHLLDRLGVDTPMMSFVYKERFPKAKQQMENRLLQFLSQNAPLSGFTSQLLQLNIVPPSPAINTNTGNSREMPLPLPPRPSSPRPQSPSPMRPISPLVTESATAIGDSLIHHRANTQYLSAGNGPQQQQLTPGNSFFGTQPPPPLPQPSQEGADSMQNRSSFISPLVGPANAAMLAASTDPQLLRLISDGATRFIHHQLCEIASDCLQKSKDDLLSCAYFCNMSVRLDEILAEAEMKVGPESFKYLTRLVKQILMIVSRAARLLECLEFDPDEFYQLLGDAEFAVREQLGSGSARVPDLPQYILTKLGLNKNLSLEHTIGADDFEERENANNNEFAGKEDLEKTPLAPGMEMNKSAEAIGRSLAQEAPKEEDFETIRLISNGAYGAVYLVKHKRNKQRFALKKMKKQTLILRNQIEQVYAERDILTFTDNPFVVCFYGSFETKQHLCMLMEYVEGGDCASLLKSAGTLPIEMARLYVAETVLAIEYLHSCGIVHRDLKPDNLLITAMGHIKLTDFGLSKIGLMNRTTLVSEGYLLQDDTQQFKDNQLCGTPEYIAPEVILRQGYGKPVDWWALGIIMYEFLVGIVPFMGDSPDALFANIINEDVEYPEEEEALDPEAESLIRMLLEKNPVDRLGTMGGAPQVSAHPFFDPIDFTTVLRQKAEFVPQLENDEDTSYFDSRCDRYNHDAESEAAEDEEHQVPMFWSFSTASPRHSIVGGLELPIGGMAMLQAAHAAAIERQELEDDSSGRGRAGTSSSSGIGSGPGSSAFGPPPSQPSKTTTGNYSDSQDSHQSFDNNNPQRINKIGPAEFAGDVIPSAVILRRRFSNQRHANVSTSSSGTTGTGAGQTNTNTCSSTDSSLDASHLGYEGGPGPRRSHGQIPRFAISPCAINAGGANVTDRRRHPPQDDSQPSSAGDHQHLSPVEERHTTAKTLLNADGNGRMQKKRPSAVVHELITDATKIGQPSTINATAPTNNNSGSLLSRQSRSASCRIPNTAAGISSISTTTKNIETITTSSSSLRVQIPHHQSTGQSSNLSPQQQQPTTYYHSYAGGGGTTLSSSVHHQTSGQHSPSCNSVSSASSLDSQQRLLVSGTVEAAGTNLDGRSPTLISPSSLLPPPSAHSIHRSSISGGQSRPIVIRKGTQGFGFTIRSVRVYLSEISEYYSIEHIVAAVRENSPAWEAGLRPNDLITHVHTQSVHNMTHPQLMHRLLSCGNELTVHVVQLSSTSIKEGEPRRNVGKPLRKKPRKPQPGKGTTKQSARNKNSSLLRRLSGKRGTGDIVPGTSSQKQTFMPRSVSSQDGVLVANTAVAAQSGQISSRQFLGPPGGETTNSTTQPPLSPLSTNTNNASQQQPPGISSKRLSIPSASTLLDSVRRKL